MFYRNDGREDKPHNIKAKTKKQKLFCVSQLNIRFMSTKTNDLVFLLCVVKNGRLTIKDFIPFSTKLSFLLFHEILFTHFNYK